jgi:acetyl-CoA carboxylase carboxyl transferase subunit beta
MDPAGWFSLLADAGRYTLLDAEPPDSLTTAQAHMGGTAVVVAVLDFAFRGGSLGVLAGDRMARAFERGAGLGGTVLVARTGGVRVQEGVEAFLGMGKVVAARAALAEARRPLLAVATDPTMGGVAGSAVAVADVLLAEPGARLALGGPRAVEATGGAARIDTAETALAAGLVDAVVPRDRLRDTLAALLRALAAP